MTTRSAIVLTVVAVCFGSLALAQPASPPLVNWTAPAYWTPPSAGEPRQGVAKKEILNRHGVSTQSLLSSPLPFVAVSPCRLYDSRANSPFTGDSTFTTDGQTELLDFFSAAKPPYANNVNPNGCTLPTAGTVGAWSLKFTYRTSSATQGYLTAFPGTLSSVPGIGTILGSSDRFTSGAAIVPAGTDADSTIKVYVQYAANTVVIDYNGYFAPPNGDWMPQGGIIMWSGSIATIPAGWGLCDGKWYDPNDLNAGQTGQVSSDSTHTIQTPDLTDRFMLSVANSSEDPGTTGGSNSHILSIAELPSHTHTGTTGIESTRHVHGGTTEYAGSHAHCLNQCGGGPTGNNGALPAGLFSGDAYTGIECTTVEAAGNHNHAFTTGWELSDHTHSFTTDPTGSGVSIDIRPAFYKLAFIMKL